MSLHCMIDLETFATTTDAVILSIGAVKFDPQSDHAVDKIYIPVDPASCQRMGMRIEASTVMWWLHPDRAEGRAQLNKDVKGGRQIDLPEAIDGFLNWWEGDARVAPISGAPSAVWSNGANFDIMIMRKAFQVCGREVPWRFWDERCFRTLKNLHKMPAVKVNHHALMDAEAQAAVVQSVAQHYRFTF